MNITALVLLFVVAARDPLGTSLFAAAPRRHNRAASTRALCPTS
jgi:hypothetical protein